MNKNTQQGFTLIELSIVLVIIGLLIGGILAAQSMIGTTKVQAFVRQMGQFDAAVVNFKDKFGGLPGDTSTVINSAANDNNGIIEDDATPVYTSVAEEMANFWPSLSTSGLKSDSGSAYIATWASGAVFTGTTNNVPKAKIGTNTTGILAYGKAGANYYVACDLGDMTAALILCEDAFSDADGLAIDVKMDEGTAVAGQVLGFAYPSGGELDDLNDLDAGSDAYTPATAGVGTILRIRMGQQAGTLE